MKFAKKRRSDGRHLPTVILFYLCCAQGLAFAGDQPEVAAEVSGSESVKIESRDLTVDEKTQFTVKKDIEKAPKSNKEEKVVKKGSKVAFHIVMQLEDGKKVFDSATDGRPWTGVVGDGSILTGINDGLYGMAEGGKRSLWIPPHQAYGANGVAPSIPANAKLYAEITLISIDAEQP